MHVLAEKHALQELSWLITARKPVWNRDVGYNVAYQETDVKKKMPNQRHKAELS